MTLRPSRADFHALAAGHTVVPVWREVVADLETPVSAFLKLVGPSGSGFLLESVENGDTWGRFSFVGRDPSLVLVARGGVIAVEALLATYRSPPLPDLPPLHGGLVGYLGYDVVREVERLPDIPPDDLGLPDAVRRLDALAADGARPIDEPVVEPPSGSDAVPEVT